MRNGREFDEYLPPRDQYATALKVNRLCDTDPKTFNPETHVADAQAIINALHSKIKSKRRFKTSILYNSSSSSNICGATDAGNFNIGFKEKKTKKIEFGVKEYRIGNYVAYKYIGRDTTEIIFEHFWDRGMTNEAFEKDPHLTALKYDNDSLDVVKISLGVPKRRKIACLRIITYQRIPLWERSQNSPKN